MKLDAAKGIAIAGTVLTLAATLVGKVSDKKQLENTVVKEVAKALEKQNN